MYIQVHVHADTYSWSYAIHNSHLLMGWSFWLIYRLKWPTCYTQLTSVWIKLLQHSNEDLLHADTVRTCIVYMYDQNQSPALCGGVEPVLVLRSTGQPCAWWLCTESKGKREVEGGGRRAAWRGWDATMEPELQGPEDCWLQIELKIRVPHSDLIWST